MLLSNLDLKQTIGEWLTSIQSHKHEEKEGAIVDLKMLDELSKALPFGAYDLVHESIQLYYHQHAQKINEIKQAYEKLQFDEAKEMAHFMKSSSYALGAMRLAYLFNLLENGVKKVDFSFDETMDEIQKTFKASQDIYQNYMKDLKNKG